MEEDNFLPDLLAAHSDKFGKLLLAPSRYRFQVLLSYTKHESSGESEFIRHGYRVDKEYFYPASTIKLAAVVASLERINRPPFSESEKFQLTTPLTFSPLLTGDKVAKDDETNSYDRKITLAHTIRKLFLVSDNQAFNHLYALVGHRVMNEIMWKKGLSSVRLHGRLALSLSQSINRCCEPVEVELESGSYALAPKRSTLVLADNAALPGVLVGKAYIDDQGKLVEHPKDFSEKSRISLLDLQDLLVMLLRPGLLIERGRETLNLEEDARSLVLEAMCQYPSASANPNFDAAEYPDDYCKFFLPGIARVRSKGAIRIYNKVGRAYGFTIDNSFIVDVETGRSFFLGAVMYTNENEILNDDKYEYEDADRAMADLGEVVAAALWQVPSTARNYSSALDKTPSSLWTEAANSSLDGALASLGSCCDNEAAAEDPLVSSTEDKVEVIEGRTIFWPYNYCLDQ